MAEQWFLLRNDQRFGPYPLEQLRTFLSQGLLTADDFLQPASGGSPVKAVSVPGLFESAPPPPPPPPPTAPVVAPQQFTQPISTTAPATTASSAASATPAPPAGLNMVATILQSSGQLWQKLSTKQRISVAGIGGLLLLVIVWSTVAKASGDGGGGKSLLQTLVDLGVVSGVVGLVFGVLQKYLEKKIVGSVPSADSSEAALGGPAAVPAPERIEMAAMFVGLSIHQWLVTLHVVVLAGLAGAVVAGFMLGASSLLVTGTALAIVGVLIARLSSRLNVALTEWRGAARRSTLTPEDLRLSKLIGLSVLVPTVPTLICPCWGLGEYTHWVWFVYASLVCLPVIHIIQRLAPAMEPFHNASGAWISGGYLAVMFVSCAILASLITRTGQPPPAWMHGTWQQVNGSGELEFTKSGTALVTGWYESSRREADDYKCRMKGDDRLVLKSTHGYEAGEVEILSKTELRVKLHGQNKRFVRASGGKRD